MNNFSELKYRFNYASPTLKLIFINAGVFILALLFNLFGFLFFGVREFLSPVLSLPSHWSDIFIKPWTILTYQFSHFGALHFAFNMLVLYFSGNIFSDFFNKKDAFKVYVFGGLIAALLFVLASNYIPVFKGNTYTLIGASGSVMAILFAATVYAPNIKVYLFGTFQVKLKWIAIAYFVMDLISISESNAGGHIAHIGGAIFGACFALYRQGKLQVQIPVPKSGSKYNSRKLKIEHNRGNSGIKNPNLLSKKGNPSQEEVDAILDKISKSGYDRLSSEEKDILFKASQD
jgi:membrane associated rhomboid family serine protease